MQRTTSVLTSLDEPDQLTVEQAADGEIPADRLGRPEFDAAVAMMLRRGLSQPVVADRLRCSEQRVLAATRRNSLAAARQAVAS